MFSLLGSCPSSIISIFFLRKLQIAHPTIKKSKVIMIPSTISVWESFLKPLAGSKLVYCSSPIVKSILNSTVFPQASWPEL